MPSLLTIPRELRDQISLYVLNAETNAAPSLDQTFDDFISPRVVYNEPRLASWSNLFLHCPNDTVSNASNLLLVNRQLHSETRENIKRIAEGEEGTIYNLDVVLVDEFLPVLTWTRVPYLTKRIDRLNATFRIAGKFDWGKERHRNAEGQRVDGAYTAFGRYKGFKIGNGAGPALSWQVYGMLERVLRVGPMQRRGCSNEHHHVVVKVLNVDIETPPGVDASRFGGPIGGSSRRRDVRGDHVLDPEFLVNFIGGNMGGLLYSENREWFKYGQMLYEHMDDIVLCKDGVQRCRWAVDGALRVRKVETKYFSSDDLDKYKVEAWEVRRTRGLKVLES